ncbi:putative mitochondrial outer membrane protein [Rosellinia necatrix]|uniref:Putative mitochondrial outer membrane protein n=1 Tax=Rosellinia necatrix TaxID=77044 RepID=A0A1S7UNM9_ROSNE|nr:putative mitochondrial outer membrane protein [Rosellinia necatrix]
MSGMTGERPQASPRAQGTSTSTSTSTSASTSASTSTSGWFTIPSPFARLFKKFPLLTYPPNELPARSPAARDVPTLYVFISDEDALNGLPSFNPSCLKWQTFLRLVGVDFCVRSSNNHASPTGALPFLLPASASSNPRPQRPIPSNKLEQYGLDKGKFKPPGDLGPRQEAYESLLDHRIRNAWLYTLYLSPANADLLNHLYIAPATSSWPVRAAMANQLRYAAELEILRSTGRDAIDPTALYREAKEAFAALETVLGNNHWFFGAEIAGLFDATVFSYTYLILHDGLAWENRRLNQILNEFPRLVRHRDRIYQHCWESQ